MNEQACGCLPNLQKPAKKGKRKILKERIRQFSIWYFENEDQKEVQHVKRRLERKKRGKTIRQVKEIRCLRWLYFLDGTVWTVGVMFTLCSTVGTLGEHTPFYKHKEMYRVIGPLTVFFAMVLLIVLSVLKRKFLKANRMNKPLRSFYILPKKVKKSQKRPVTVHRFKNCQSFDTDDSGNIDDIGSEKLQKTEQFWARNYKETVSAKKSDTFHDTEILLQTLPSDPNKTLPVNIMSRADKRKAWAKTKWLRMNISSESSEYLDDCITKDLAQSRMLETKDSLEKYPILTSVSMDSESLDTVSVMKVDHTIKRDFSTKSKTSEVSNFSNFSETAPLVKR